jgi:hypothetical protein
MKPELFLHPGFPKCATSTIQRAFVVNGHGLANYFQVGFLGRQFQPNAGYPPVVQLMDNPQSCIEAVRDYKYKLGSYFLSNEALPSSVDFVKELERIFIIRRTAFTVRLPVLQAISQFRYSGWTQHSFSKSLASGYGSIFSTKNRLIPRLKYFENISAEFCLCPIEVTDGNVVERFCGLLFDRSVADIGRCDIIDSSISNKSVSLAFAQALFHAVSSAGIGKISVREKRNLVVAAKKVKLPAELSALSVTDLKKIDLDIWADQVKSYCDLMIEFNTPEDVRLDAIQRCQADIEALVSAPVATINQERELEQFANEVVNSVLKEN